MYDYVIYSIMAIQTLAIVYLIIKVRQPVTVVKRRSGNPKDEIPELDDLGTVLKEMQPEIEKALKLDEEQKKTLDRWVTTIDTITKSKIINWIVKKVQSWS